MRVDARMNAMYSKRTRQAGGQSNCTTRRKYVHVGSYVASMPRMVAQSDWPPTRRVRWLLSRIRGEHRDLFAIVIQLVRAQIDIATALRAEQVETSLRFQPALLHRQLEIEDHAPAPAFAQPRRHPFGDANRLFHHVADHPVESVLRMPGKA